MRPTIAEDLPWATIQLHRFHRPLRQLLDADPRVLGLVALGSMSQRDYQPDRHFDHDFFVITRPGTHEEFRSQLDWIPNSHRIVISYRETMHGLKVLLEGPHLFEFAISEPAEVSLAHVYRYRVLIDRCNLQAALAACKEVTDDACRKGARDDHFHICQVSTILYVGVCRHRRGEAMSGHHMVRDAVPYQLLPLLSKLLPSDRKSLLDNPDPFCRFDLVFPAIATELHQLFLRDVPSAALGILDLAEREFFHLIPDFPSRGFAEIRRFIATD